MKETYISGLSLNLNEKVPIIITPVNLKRPLADSLTRWPTQTERDLYAYDHT
jgi:hypothetical protein